MKKVETTHGYDIYELTKEECEERYYVYPTYAVFCEGESYETEPFEETSEESLESARRWCEHFSRL